MATEKSVMAVIRACRPNFRNDHDRVAFAVHASFLASGSMLTATGPPAFSDDSFSSPSTEEVGIDRWNELPDEYAFVYINPEKGSKTGKVLVKCLVMNDKLVVDALANKGLEPVHLEIDVRDYVKGNGGNNFLAQYKDLDKLVELLNTEVLSKLDGTKPARMSPPNVKALKAAWSPEHTELYLNLCIGEIQAGNRPGSSFKKIAWVNIRNKFNASTGLNYDAKQFKNKWDNLRKEWQLWIKLVGNEPNLGWDYERNTVVADDEWWEKKLKEIPEAIKFRHKGLLCKDRMEVVFKGYMAPGEKGRATTPTFGVLPISAVGVGDYHHVDVSQRALGRNEGSGESSDNVLQDLTLHETPVGFTTPTNFTSTPPLDSTPETIGSASVIGIGQERAEVDRSAKKGRFASNVTSQIDRLINAVESRTCGSLNQDDPVSIEAVMKLVLELPGMVEGSPLWYDACMMMLETKNRRMFMVNTTPETRLCFLERYARTLGHDVKSDSGGQ